MDFRHAKGTKSDLTSQEKALSAAGETVKDFFKSDLYFSYYFMDQAAPIYGVASAGLMHTTTKPFIGNEVSSRQLSCGVGPLSILREPTSLPSKLQLANSKTAGPKPSKDTGCYSTHSRVPDSF